MFYFAGIWASEIRGRPRGGLLQSIIILVRVGFILLNKPYRVLSQFRDAENRATLADYVRDKSVYPAGRLDFESEGLLLLTDDGKLQARISQPRSKLVKSYWVQVEGLANESHIGRLLDGVALKDGRAAAVKAENIAEPPRLWPREPPIRERRSIPTSWLDLGIMEGRNRQVRRMTAAVGLPALRLVRHRIGPWSLGELQPGETRCVGIETAWRELSS